MEEAGVPSSLWILAPFLRLSQSPETISLVSEHLLLPAGRLDTLGPCLLLSALLF